MAMVFSTDDTIVAIATPRGVGGLGLVRLSGPQAHAIVVGMMGRRTPLAVRQATFGRLRTNDSAGVPSTVDQVVVTRFNAPRSFTGDDVVEITAHGSDFLLRRIVELAMAAGARLAEPGEFTFRAYVNGRLDLVQAEAVADLVNAVTPLQARAAMDQLEGTLTAAIGRLDGALFDLIARLEASLDFPEEGFHFVTPDQAADELATIRAALENLIREGRAGRVVREGSLVVLCGRPNAGKSSLFNALVGSERAIVTEIPGTTRDLLSERVDIGGLLVTLVDTAGLRDAEDAIEAEGVRRAQEAQRVAALTVLLIDSAAPITDSDRAALSSVRGPRIIVASKSDRPSAWRREDERDMDAVVPVSVKTGEGLDGLRRTIVRELTDREQWAEPPAVSNLRHLQHLEESLAAVNRASQALRQGASEEMALADLHPARESLEAIAGRRAPDELLAHIFSRFCIGK